MKTNKTETPKKSKTTGFKHFMVALAVIVVLISTSYTAFITAVGVGGKTNLYLAAPSIVATAGIISYAVYKTVQSFNK